MLSGEWKLECTTNRNTRQTKIKFVILSMNDNINGFIIRERDTGRRADVEQNRTTNHNEASTTPTSSAAPARRQ